MTLSPLEKKKLKKKESAIQEIMLIVLILKTCRILGALKDMAASIVWAFIQHPKNSTV